MIKPNYKTVFGKNAKAKSMAAYADKIWAETYAYLENENLITTPRQRTLDRYVRAMVEYQFLYPEVVAKGPVKVGPNGGDVFDGRWSALEKLNERIGKFEQSLLLSPQAAGAKRPESNDTQGKTPAKAQKFFDRRKAQTH